MSFNADRLLDLERFPLDRPGEEAYAALVADCRQRLDAKGLFNLPGFMRPEAVEAAVAVLAEDMAARSFFHRRDHNIYFDPEIPGLPADHPALRLCRTSNHTLCADQLRENPITAVYEYPPLRRFLAAVRECETLHLMEDALARVNVIAYRAGEALNWHFDRSETTTTLLLQNPVEGGAFEYRRNLRGPGDPNYEGVARLLEGADPDVQTLSVAPGTLTVFRGVNTAHRIAPVAGPRERIIAIFSYYERPGVLFSDKERIGFYGRAG